MYSYDFIFIGGGISSLYCVYKLLKNYPNLKVLLLEKTERLGGKTWKETFCNTRIVVGAGVLRKTDTLMIKLIKELKINYTESIHPIYKLISLDKTINIKDSFLKLKKEYNCNPAKYDNLTFKKFGTEILGSKLYKQFRLNSEYTDFDNQNVYDTLYNYGYEGNYNNEKVLFVDWTVLVNLIKDKLNTYAHFTPLKI